MRARDYPFFDGGFLAFAHRGGSLLPTNIGRENTMHAFAAAVELGYRYLETDVHATSDGVLVAFHDERLDRVTNGTGLIAEKTWPELASLVVGERDRIPRLVDVLVGFPDTRFNIDAKSDQAVDLLADTIEHLNAHERVCVSSFSPQRLRRLRSRVGNRVASSQSSWGVGWTRLGVGLSSLIAPHGQALQIPVRHRIAGKEVTLVTPGLVRRAHRAGKQVHVWTIDEAAEMERLIDLGVDGLFTDRPDVLRTVLHNRGLWQE
ncbi:MAG TPA: glycerophosphodiester phosphodiesterase [Candidatus Avipropionibacterium avicola]|uniref:Glycerophosphodiester phosphodiesterase n=1 Tax=Candidatus Avipropionibacterium avicola TaxID=2840701 RepID=A0A9D1GWK4_9ACTN|nr:glycerophosphodiester phosphodiesterase [Candidatus Avipropionibacterium avicola]